MLWETRVDENAVKLGDVIEFVMEFEGGFEFLRKVYVAYVDRDDELIDCYVVSLMPGEDPVDAVARDARSRPAEMCQVVVGEAAELLHLAIAGRMSGEDVRLACCQRAVVARGILAYADREDFAVCYAAAARFGDWIRPWWGMTLLDERGRIVLDAVEYGERVDLPLGVVG